jgi:hypothetical protein
MLKQKILLMALAIGVNSARAQDDAGPKMMAMGGNSATIIDVWGVTNNPSIISKIKTTVVAAQYLKYLINQELSSQAFAILLPFKRNTFGIGMHRYGIAQFNELKLSGLFSKEFGEHLAIALRLNYHQLKISNYGASTGISIDFGFCYQLSSELLIGFYFNNPAKMQFTDRALEKVIPSIVFLGLSYQISDNVLMSTTISKADALAIGVGFGLDYKILACLSARAGINLQPFQPHAGFGLTVSHLTIDIAITTNPFSSYTPQIGIAYAF